MAPQLGVPPAGVVQLRQLHHPVDRQRHMRRLAQRADPGQGVRGAHLHRLAAVRPPGWEPDGVVRRRLQREGLVVRTRLRWPAAQLGPRLHAVRLPRARGVQLPLLCGRPDRLRLGRQLHPDLRGGRRGGGGARQQGEALQAARVSGGGACERRQLCALEPDPDRHVGVCGRRRGGQDLAAPCGSVMEQIRGRSVMEPPCCPP
mmetsp:Transcript_37451/g.95782  ORF Transcript_37451/g.95782 Transcript_37451/m.95782 type:complete len:203 (+) Transcript_37451:515-1123(+)